VEANRKRHQGHDSSSVSILMLFPGSATKSPSSDANPTWTRRQIPVLCHDALDDVTLTHLGTVSILT
jgi:hypothetical protein